MIQKKTSKKSLSWRVIDRHSILYDDDAAAAAAAGVAFARDRRL